MQTLLVLQVDGLVVAGLPLRDEEMALDAVCQRDRHPRALQRAIGRGDGVGERT
jgi:hypothetical protein